MIHTKSAPDIMFDCFFSSTILLNCLFSFCNSPITKKNSQMDERLLTSPPP